jgi:hypothetical protein
VGGTYPYSSRSRLSTFSITSSTDVELGSLIVEDSARDAVVVRNEIRVQGGRKSREKVSALVSYAGSGRGAAAQVARASHPGVGRPPARGPGWSRNNGPENGPAATFRAAPAILRRCCPDGRESRPPRATPPPSPRGTARPCNPRVAGNSRARTSRCGRPGWWCREPAGPDPAPADPTAACLPARGRTTPSGRTRRTAGGRPCPGTVRFPIRPPGRSAASSLSQTREERLRQRSCGNQTRRTTRLTRRSPLFSRGIPLAIPSREDLPVATGHLVRGRDAADRCASGPCCPIRGPDARRCLDIVVLWAVWE